MGHSSSKPHKRGDGKTARGRDRAGAESKTPRKAAADSPRNPFSPLLRANSCPVKNEEMPCAPWRKYNLPRNGIPVRAVDPVRKIRIDCRATIGQLGNVEHESKSLGKAGRSRWMGRKGRVRGVAMNPVDHPLGGGEGKSSGGRHPVTPWGKATKGLKTRKRSKGSNRYIVKDRRK